MENCENCSAQFNTADILAHLPVCPICQKILRPDIVWFGEMPYYINKIVSELKRCDLFIVIGTSGIVYPVAGFLDIARQNGAYCLGINKEAPANVGNLHEYHEGKAGEILPALVEKWSGR